MGSRLNRRLAGACLVMAASLGTGIAARKTQKPYAPDAPAYRQKGPVEAPIVIVEFSDFQCPACAAAVAPLKGLKELHGDKIRVIFKHFPLERPHPRARAAAGATECAGRQGKFWEMHDALFGSQEKWGHDHERGTQTPGTSWLIEPAKAAGLDLAAFESCLKDPAMDAAVAADMKEGDERWVGSTPTFFINGKRFVGARQLSTLGTMWVDKQLKRKS